jgi:hypothetical protein
MIRNGFFCGMGGWVSCLVFFFKNLFCLVCVFVLRFFHYYLWILSTLNATNSDTKLLTSDWFSSNIRDRFSPDIPGLSCWWSFGHSPGEKAIGFLYLCWLVLRADVTGTMWPWLSESSNNLNHSWLTSKEIPFPINWWLQLGSLSTEDCRICPILTSIYKSLKWKDGIFPKPSKNLHFE